MVPAGREQWQGLVLARGVGAVLGLWTAFLLCMVAANPHSRSSEFTLKGLFFSLTFGLVVWGLRAATPIAALLGTLICLNLTVWTGQTDQSMLRSGLSPLLGLFVLTFLASRAGRAFRGERVAARDAEESAHGRNAAQIAANLGMAALAAAAFPGGPGNLNKVVVLAALAEATADTVSSEIGAAFGGRPWLITSFQRVEAGTDGAVSLVGTLAGCAGAALVVGAGVWAMRLPVGFGIEAFLAAFAGLLFDSVLGATLERRGVFGNDWVNFGSTVFAAGVALTLVEVASGLW